MLGVRVIDSLYAVGRSGDTDSRLLYQTRNFFSIVRVLDMLPDDPELHHVMLKHGTTSHGSQFYRRDLRRVPVSYFGIFTGMGMLMHERPEAPMHVGIMGLGAGALAAYGREGDRYQFYEIDPDVIRVTRDDGYFSYLADSRAAIEIIPGDARLSLEAQLREAGPQNFDLLIMDAFSSDSVPVHLITLEAMELYLQHLKPERRIGRAHLQRESRSRPPGLPSRSRARHARREDRQPALSPPRTIQCRLDDPQSGRQLYRVVSAHRGAGSRHPEGEARGTHAQLCP